MKKIKITDISIKNRQRRDLGDIKSLAANIKRDGLINPITLTNDLKLVAGERRLTAISMNGEEYVDAHIVSVIDEGDLYRLEYSENEYRKDFTLTEKARLLQLITPKNGTKKHLGDYSPTLQTQDERRDKLAKAVGLRSRDDGIRLKRITNKGIQDLMDLVDLENVTISAAYQIADLSESDQAKAIQSHVDNKNWKLYSLHKCIIEKINDKSITKEIGFSIQKRSTEVKTDIKSILGVELRRLEKIRLNVNEVQSKKERTIENLNTIKYKDTVDLANQVAKLLHESGSKSSCKNFIFNLNKAFKNEVS